MDNENTFSIPPELAAKFLEEQDRIVARKNKSGQIDSDIEEKSGLVVKSKGDLYTMLGAEITPEMEKKNPYLSAIAKTAQEGIATPAFHFLNQAGMNYPRALTQMAGYDYPESESMAGQILSKSAGIAGALSSPVAKVIGAAGKLPTTAGQGAVQGAIKGGTIGALYAPDAKDDKGIANPKQRLLQALIGGGVGAGVGTIAGSVRDSLYARPEKVNKIKEGMRTYWRQNIKEYGETLKNVQKQSDGKAGVDPSTTLEWLKNDLIEKGIINEAGKKIGKSFSRVTNREMQLFQKLQKDIKNISGRVKVPLETVLQAGRDIKASGGKFKTPTTLSQEADKVQRGIVGSVKDQIKSDEFLKSQAKYAEFRDKFDLVNDKFDIWSSKLRTGKGEKSLSGIFKDGEMRMIGKIIEDETGVNLTSDKILSFLSQPQNHNIIGSLGVVGGLIWATRQITKALAGNDSGGSENRTD